jgi:hypothetical protein
MDAGPSPEPARTLCNTRHRRVTACCCVELPGIYSGLVLLDVLGLTSPKTTVFPERNTLSRRPRTHVSPDRDALEGWHVHDGWRVEMKLREQAGQMVIAELAVRPERALPNGGLSAAWLKQLPIVAFAQDHQRAGKWTHGRAPRPGDVQLALEAGGELALAATARLYLAHLAVGESKPDEALAESLGLSIHAARKRLSRARYEHGLLTPPPTPGKAGGSLTTKAKRLLAKES